MRDLIKARAAHLKRVQSKEEAVQWAMRCPGGENEIIEVRQVQEFEDFTPEVQKAAEGFAQMQRSPKP